MNTFLKFVMWICAALAFVSFFFMAAGTACGNNSILVLLIGTLAFLAFSSAAQFLKNYFEWKEKERERESIKRYLSNDLKITKRFVKKTRKRSYIND